MRYIINIYFNHAAVVTYWRDYFTIAAEFTVSLC
jgi:hypothetical protein